MRFFDQGSPKKPIETIVIMTTEEAKVIYTALEEYTKKNKRKIKAKKIMAFMADYWSIF